MIAEIIEQRGFACAGAAGNQQALGRIFIRAAATEVGLKSISTVLDFFSHFMDPPFSVLASGAGSRST